MDVNKNELPNPENSLGLADGRLGNGHFSASTYMDCAHAWQGRLGNFPKGNAKVGAWCPKELNKNQYLQVDLGEVQKVGSIATQGRPDLEEDGGWFVQTYTLAYSLDGDNWSNYKEFGIPKVFEANQDHDSIVVNELKVAVNARYFRVKPVTWNQHIALRMELYKDLRKKGAVDRTRVSGGRNTMDQRRQGGTVNAKGVSSSQRIVTNGVVNVHVQTRQKSVEDDVITSRVPQGQSIEDKGNQERMISPSQARSPLRVEQNEDSAGVLTGDRKAQEEIQRPVPVSVDGEPAAKAFSRLTKQASATVTSSQGEKYIGKIKLIKKEQEEEEGEERPKIEKKEIDCDIKPIVKQRIKAMSSEDTEPTNNERRSVLLDEEIRYTQDMETHVNQRVEMFREAERQNREREEAEKQEQEKRKEERLKRAEDLKRKMQDSSDGSPVHSDSGKSDGFDGSVEPINPAQRAVKSHMNGALGESWENLSIEGQEDTRQNIEFEQKLEGIGNEHEGYDPERERTMLDQTEEAFRSFATQGKQSPGEKPQGGKTSMLIKSFSVMQDSSEKPPVLRRQLSEPRTPSRVVVDEVIEPVAENEAESAPPDDLLSSSSSAPEDTQEIEVGFVRKASERYKSAVETHHPVKKEVLQEFEVEDLADVQQGTDNETELEEEPDIVAHEQVSDIFLQPTEENVPESIPDMDEIVEENVMDGTQSDAAEVVSLESVSTHSTESDLKDIESGIVRKFKERFIEQQRSQEGSVVSPRAKPKPQVSTGRVFDPKERSASTGSEASESHVSESMSLELVMKEISDTQLRMQGSERHVAIAKERLEQCQAFPDSAEAVEAEEEYHEACLELSRLRKKLLRLQKQAKESGTDIEIDFKSLDRSGALLYAPTRKVDGLKVSRECKAPTAKAAPPVDTSVYNDEGECVPEGNVLSQIKAFEKLKGK